MRTAGAAGRQRRLPPLAFLAIFHCASASLAKTNTREVESATAETLQALNSLFGEPVVLHTLTHGSGAAVVAFKAGIQIGYPQQRVELIIDTGSSALAVALPGCQTRNHTPCAQGGYAPDESWTYRKRKGSDDGRVTMTYDQGGWMGFRGRDQVAFLRQKQLLLLAQQPVTAAAANAATALPTGEGTGDAIDEADVPVTSASPETAAPGSTIAALGTQIVHAVRGMVHRMLASSEGEIEPSWQQSAQGGASSQHLRERQLQHTRQRQWQQTHQHQPAQEPHTTEKPQRRRQQRPIPRVPPHVAHKELDPPTPATAPHAAGQQQQQQAAPVKTPTAAPLSTGRPEGLLRMETSAYWVGSDRLAVDTVPEVRIQVPFPTLGRSSKEPEEDAALTPTPLAADAAEARDLFGAGDALQPPRPVLTETTEDQSSEPRVTINSIEEAWSIFTVHGHQGVLGLSPRSELARQHKQFALFLSPGYGGLWLAPAAEGHVSVFKRWRRLAHGTNSSMIRIRSRPSSLHYETDILDITVRRASSEARTLRSTFDLGMGGYSCLQIGTVSVLAGMPPANASHPLVTHAVIDTGTTFLLLPHHWRAALIQAMQPMVPVNPALWRDFCVRTHPSFWPAITLHLGPTKEQQLVLHGHHYLAQQSPGFYCLGIGQSSENDEVILGLTALMDRMVAISLFDQQLLVTRTASVSLPSHAGCHWLQAQFPEEAGRVLSCTKDCHASPMSDTVAYCHAASVSVFAGGRTRSYTARLSWRVIEREHVFSNERYYVIVSCPAQDFYPLQCYICLEVAWAVTALLGLVVIWLIRIIVVANHQIKLAEERMACKKRLQRAGASLLASDCGHPGFPGFLPTSAHKGVTAPTLPAQQSSPEGAVFP